MKKSTVVSMLAYLNGETVDVDALRTELEAEKAKLEDSSKRRADMTAAKTAAINEKVIPLVLEVLSHTLEGMTVKEIFARGADYGEWPEGYSDAKLQSVFTRGYLDGKVVKHDNGRNAKTYTLAE